MKELNIDGQACLIRTDLRTAIDFMRYIEKNQAKSDEEFVMTLLELWYPQVPRNRDRAFGAMIAQYMGGDTFYKPLFKVAEYDCAILPKLIREKGKDAERMEWDEFRTLYRTWTKRPYHKRRLKPKRRKLA